MTDRPDQPDTLPPLDERQARVISAFVSTPGPLTDTAKALGLSLPDLLAVLASEPVRAHLEAARDATELKFQLTAAAARDAALETLKTITRDAEADPIERRRAASAILRALTRRRRTTSASLSPPGERAGVRGLLQWAGTPSGAGVTPASAPSPSPVPPSPLKPSPTPAATIQSALAALRSAPDADAGLAAIYPLFNPTWHIDMPTPDAFCSSPSTATLRRAWQHANADLHEPRTICHNYAEQHADLTTAAGDRLSITFGLVKFPSPRFGVPERWLIDKFQHAHSTARSPPPECS